MSVDRKAVEVQEEVKRPFRLWDAGAKQQVHWHYYKTKEKALDGALLLIHRCIYVGTTYEVIDIRTMALAGSYTRNVKSITIIGETYHATRHLPT